ncbi:MAG: DUF2169 domain-containing protein [Chitinivibrionales bacterium]|nr:DUF2169 domain-containing protein [Chitinivibrionales bacterium]MBD3355676.1 DUF2169 domain-containing protein [Chitinivibrionales bacterium]
MSWQSILIPGYESGGKPIVSVIAKKTYVFAHGRVKAAEEQVPIYHDEVPADPQNPLGGETLAEPDIVPFKPKTDVVVVGKAHAPRGYRTNCMTCKVFVGPVHKAIRVYGERKVEAKLIRGLSFTEAEPFKTRELGYRHAFGGVAKSKEGFAMPFPPNPLGKGFYLKGGIEDPEEIEVPCCEDPNSPIEPDALVLGKYADWPRAPKPVSFGWTKPSFYPRNSYAGIVPEMLPAQQGKDPKAGKDGRLDFRFYQGASEGMGEHSLEGNEHVKLIYMDPDHKVFEFALPSEKPAIAIGYGKDRTEVPVALHTVLIDKNNNKLSMVWRGCKESEGSEAPWDGGLPMSFVVE